MDKCEGLACQECKRQHTRGWGDGWRAGYENGKDEAAKVLQAISASLKLGNTVAAWDTCLRALKEVQK